MVRGVVWAWRVVRERNAVRAARDKRRQKKE
jgi:hypothetical protein